MEARALATVSARLRERSCVLSFRVMVMSQLLSKRLISQARGFNEEQHLQDTLREPWQGCAATRST